MRWPEKVEKQFTAHGGPVFSIDWHPEDRNWFATAGRDKTIKVSLKICTYQYYPEYPDRMP